MLISIILGVILDFAVGDPYSFPHPVKLMGRIISFEEKIARKITKSNKGLKLSGFIIVIVNISIGFFMPYILLKTIKQYKTIYTIVNTYLIYTCIAARCLHDEAIKVSKALDIGIEEARTRLSYIVGRETKNLSEEEIIRATVETVAENTSDGVIAPLFYIIFLGASGGLAYKFVNTMDSMLGYKNEKYIDLGFFPAKVDDIFNYIPARITGVFMCIGSIFRFNIRNGFKIMIRDRKNHKSPNCAYPEGAVAGLLDIQLGGDNYYHGKLVKKPNIGDKIKKISRADIRNTIEIMYRSEMVFLLIYILIFCL
ncbi:adenosylcobinamide-phosphate synthase [Tissierella praeacuta DSM 18095]|uniref:Cobalamin biosynthesis protein CobD n=1 Tax=Tissierella praeacuta DSM 18095 TaxID=1123404 RepID=A0A1M4WX54_9FIRM|nr:adenosylcobinamide-phosphate synthase CbiB [Tissierella praeacuta]SHE85778.1 adenosylcobinamide-phosphate synthase [Tissierella praeacuta DSM 18095]SUP00389.1 cobalamin biosynthesis protein [Tissierella praeacuta]